MSDPPDNKDYIDTIVEIVLARLNQKLPVGVKFIDDEARKFGLPSYKYDGDAGVDLFVILDECDRKNGLTIFPGEKKLLSTGIHLQFPPGIWGRIIHRSSTETKWRLRVIEGTIDSGFTGALFTQVINNNTFPIRIDHGSRIAQLILMSNVTRPFVEINELVHTSRGQNGFGSSGI